MAIVALVAGRNVIKCFSGRLDSVVTGYTAAGYGRVVHIGNDRPVGGYVTI